MKEIRYFKLENGKEPVWNWIYSLDKSMQIRVLSRVVRISEENYGDCKMIGSEIWEARFKFGPGYRVYFSEIENTIILFLCAGDKNRQSSDIKIAKEYLSLYKEKRND